MNWLTSILVSASPNSPPAHGLYTGIFGLLLLIPTVIVYLKRFHDRDKSGWWVLIGLIPIIDMLSSPQAKALLAGVAAMLVKRFMQGSSRTA